MNRQTRLPLTLHFGAHRTGSTAAQSAMAAHLAAHPEADIAFAGPDDLRPVLSWTMHVMGAVPFAWRLATPLLMTMTAPRARAVVTSAATRRVISEEGFLGPMAECLLGRAGPYPRARRRLGMLRRMIGSREARPVLTVRSYDDWFVSMYSWTVLHRPLPPVSALAAEWAARARGWPEIVEDVVSVFGSCEVVDFAAFRRDSQAVARAILGEAAAGMPPVTRVGASLSAKALAAVEARRAAGDAVGLEDRLELRLAFRGPPVDPFDEETRAALRARYARDLDRIAARGVKVTR